MASKVTLVIPTAVNVVTAVAENINKNRRLGFDPQVSLPSVRQRAYMVVNETGVLPVQDVTDDTAVTIVRGA